MRRDASKLWLVDAIKVVAAQLIVWHHLAAYGPMSDAAHAYLPTLIDWLYTDARLAVQAFLVVGGFLAARALIPAPGQAAPEIAVLSLPRLLWSRYTRLVPTYVVAIGLALVAAAFAREFAFDPDVPGPASAQQVLAHVFLLHDVLGQPALSAGVWYVAIDFQLYGMLACLVWLGQRIALRTRLPQQILIAAACVGLMLLSLFWFNLQAALDKWAPYFFGSYGLGILVQWGTQSKSRWTWPAAIVAMVAAALIFDWRYRIAVAGCIALLLVLGVNLSMRWSSRWQALVSRLGNRSYSLFLVHYPVSLAVGASVHWLWPESSVIAAAGLLLSYGASLVASAFMHRLVEVRMRALPWFARA